MVSMLSQKYHIAGEGLIRALKPRELFSGRKHLVLDRLPRPQRGSRNCLKKACGYSRLMCLCRSYRIGKIGVSRDASSSVLT